MVSSLPHEHSVSVQSHKYFSNSISSTASLMAKHNSINNHTSTSRPKATSFLSDALLYPALAMVAFLAVWAVWSFCSPSSSSTPSFSTATFSEHKINNNIATPPCTADTVSSPTSSSIIPDSAHDPLDSKTFYDDPDLTYTIDSPPIKNWDEKRADWLNKHPSFIPGSKNRILLITGSQATPCKNPIGDYLLLKLFKNKVDYCRLHGIDIFYNNVLLQPQMWTYWAKTPIVKAAMLAHPEVEWIWWVDSDAAFTDMDFKLPLERYKDHNMVVHGWKTMIYEAKSWTGLNAGVFLIRNSQWAMDFMDVWASMGPQSPDYNKWGETLSSLFKDKVFKDSDDQSGLVYLLLNEKEKWGNKIYIESEYYFEGYWVEIVEKFENVTEKYVEIEKREPGLRRRHAEKVRDAYGGLWSENLKDLGYAYGSLRRPFVTHFTGCQPCSGDHNQQYSGQSCFEGVQRALAFADNQVLRRYGFVHPDLGDPTVVKPVPFDYPV